MPDEICMESHPARTIRPCPLCGVAMQARKSRENLADFDTFECLTCHTTIAQPPAPSRNNAT